MPESPAQRKRLFLRPRSKPATEEQKNQEATANSESDNESDEEEPPVGMTEDQSTTMDKLSSTTIEEGAIMSSPSTNYVSATEGEAETTFEMPVSRFYRPSTSKKPPVQLTDKRETNTPRSTTEATVLNQILEVVTQTRRESKLVWDTVQDLQEAVAGMQKQLSSLQEQLDGMQEHMQVGASVVLFMRKLE